MKKILLFCIVIFRFVEAVGQGKDEKILYLKNGSVVKGKIIAELPDKYIRIKLSDKRIAKYLREEVDSIRNRDEMDSIGNTDVIPIQNRQAYRAQDLTVIKNRMAYKAPDSTVNFYLIAETGPGIGIGQNGSSKFIFNLKEYFQINRYYGVGMGLGYRYYFREQTTSIPVFVHYRIQLPQNKLKPFYSFGIGISPTPRNNYFETTIYDPIIMHNIGVNYSVNKKIKVHFGLGIEIQNIRKYFENNPRKRIYQQSNRAYYDRDGNIIEIYKELNTYSITLIGGITF